MPLGQDAAGASSSEQVKVAPASEPKAKVADVSLVDTSGPLSIVVARPVVSTVQVAAAGLASVLPAASLARTRNVCSPSARPLSATGETQDANAAPSRAHSKVALGSDENSNDALVLVVEAAGPEVIVVSGATAGSTVHSHGSGVSSGSPCELMPRTSNMWSPSARLVYVFG